MPRSRRRRRSPGAHSATLRLGLVFAALIGLNVYFFLFRGGTSLPGLLKAAEVRRDPVRDGAPSSRAARSVPARASVTSGPAGAAQRPVGPAAFTSASDGGRSVQSTLRPGDSVAAVLGRDGVSPRMAADAVGALGRILDLRRVRAGHTVVARLDADDRLRAVDVRMSATSAWRVERHPGAGGDAWRGQKLVGALESRVVTVSGTVVTTLDEALVRAGEDPSLARSLVELLAFDLDLQRDVRPGDRFVVVVEKQTLAGRFERYGRVLAIEWGGQPAVRASWWERAHGYYTDGGEALARSLLRTPLGYHPLVNSSAAAATATAPAATAAAAPATIKAAALAAPSSSPSGADYPATPGSSVHALADGKVSERGPSSITVRSSGGMEVSYAHLLRGGRTLALGETVHQQQILGTVDGHLHIAVRMGGHSVDPLRLKPARRAPLPPAERAAFARTTASLRP